jgi:hypothetical protein
MSRSVRPHRPAHIVAERVTLPSGSGSRTCFTPRPLAAYVQSPARVMTGRMFSECAGARLRLAVERLYALVPPALGVADAEDSSR